MMRNRPDHGTARTHSPRQTNIDRSRGTWNRRRYIVPLCLLALLAVPHSAFSQSLDSLLARGDFNAAQEAEVELLFAAATDTAIPRTLLLPRLAEGIAKRVPAPRIIQSLRTEVVRLQEARELLQNANAEALVEDVASWARTANLLRAGLTARSLGELAAEAEYPDRYRPASALLVSLTEWGIAEDVATQIAAAAAVSQMDPDEYPVVLELLIQARRARVSVDETVTILLEELPRAASARALRRALRF